MKVEFLHTMVRVKDLDASIAFYKMLGLVERRRSESEGGRFTLIYELCQQLMDAGVTINRPPRDGHMAFVRSPDNVSIELLQMGEALPAQEPWASMENTGHW